MDTSSWNAPSTGAPGPTPRSGPWADTTSVWGAAPAAPPAPPTSSWPSGPPTGAPPPPPPTPGWGRPDPGPPPAGPVPPSGTRGGARPPRRGGKVVAAALAVALVAGAAGGAGYALGDAVAGDDATATATPNTTASVRGVDSSTEPVAAVADALSPAVVQLDTQTGLGSGFVYDAEQGLIMTAAHVVDGAQEVDVRLADGRVVAGQVVGADDGTDIAVVRVEADGLTAATLALDDPVEVGQLAVAIGSPFGLDQTVTSGVVSAVGRSVETPGGAVPMIQTDAPINPGNSGGALADRTGRIIGVNDSIASESGGNVGVGFAVPIATAKAVADRLVQGLPITNGYLGVSAADASGERSGAQVVQVEAGSPGAEAGLQEGDVVTSIDGTPIDSSAELVAAIRSREPGTEITLGVSRQGQDAEVTVTLGEAPTR